MAGHGKKVGREVAPVFPRVVGDELPLSPDGASLIACSERAKEALLQWCKVGYGAATDAQNARFNKVICEKIMAKVKRHVWINHRHLSDASDKNGLRESISSEALIEYIANDYDCDGLQASRGSCSYVGKRNFADERQTVRANSQKLINGLCGSLPGTFPIKGGIGIATPILVENREAFLASARPCPKARRKILTI